MALHNRIQSFGYAFTGIKTAWKEEMNFKIHVASAFAALILGFAFHITKIEWMIIILLIGFVTATEILNTALEEFCDMVQSNPDPHIGKIKDLAAGAVLLSSLAALVIGCLIFFPYIQSLL